MDAETASTTDTAKPCQECCWHSALDSDGVAIQVCCGCHTEKEVEGVKSLFALQSRRVRTQKAAGLAALNAAGYKVPTPIWLAQSAADAAAFEPYLSGSPTPWFARPCPVTPRPGFVDSRVVKTVAQLATVWQETVKAEPKGEVLLMPLIDAAYNICITPGQMAVGPGHDGATAGKASRSFGLVGTLPNNSAPLLKAARITAALHMEGVITKRKEAAGYNGVIPAQYWWTQARSGPKHPGGVDYIPQAMEVKKVVKPLDDLLEWEAFVKEADPDGLAVWGSGHSLASHAALHCIGKGIAFVTSFEPKVGQTIDKVDELPYDATAFVAGMGWGLNVDIMENQRQKVMTILYGLHHASALKGPDAWWLGYAAAAMLRIGISCACGESNGQCGQPPQDEDHGYHGAILKGFGPFKRNLNHMPRLMEGFFINGLFPDGSAQVSGIGGHNWGRCIYSCFPLMQAMQNVYDTWMRVEDCNAAINSLIVALNKAVDQAHNGAWWLNRYAVNPGDFTNATEGGWQCAFEAAPFLYETALKRDEVKFIEEGLKYAAKFAALPKPAVPTFACTASIDSHGLLAIKYKAREWVGGGGGSYAPKVPKVLALQGQAVETKRRMDKTRFCIDFIQQQGDKVALLWTEVFEFEIDPRKKKKEAA